MDPSFSSSCDITSCILSGDVHVELSRRRFKGLEVFGFSFCAIFAS
jgi:hypothetical protein